MSALSMTPEKVAQRSADRFESNVRGNKTDSDAGRLLHLPYLLPRRKQSGQFGMISNRITPRLETSLDSPDSFDAVKMKRSRDRQSIITNELHKPKPHKTGQTQEQNPIPAKEQYYPEPPSPLVQQTAGKRIWQHRILLKDQSDEAWRRRRSESQISITQALHNQTGQTPRRPSSSPERSRRPGPIEPSEPQSVGEAAWQRRRASI